MVDVFLCWFHFMVFVKTQKVEDVKVIWAKFCFRTIHHQMFQSGRALHQGHAYAAWKFEVWWCEASASRSLRLCFLVTDFCVQWLVTHGESWSLRVSSGQWTLTMVDERSLLQTTFFSYSLWWTVCFFLQMRIETLLWFLACSPGIQDLEPHPCGFARESPKKDRGDICRVIRTSQFDFKNSGAFSLRGTTMSMSIWSNRLPLSMCCDHHAVIPQPVYDSIFESKHLNSE